ncbi:hypothetical protein ACPWSR_07170 [Alloiococcus sp. CFN-8]|uniref:hypothetical protein n=1 Tax=Alloiococcus sp. CFN-8 TaxID=3416081 RepID=UPI003CF0A398
MRVIYYIFFCIAVIYTLISLVLGGIFDGLDIGGEGAFDGFLSGLKPILIISFSIVFGGIGLLTVDSLSWYISLGVSAGSAFFTSFLINKLVVLPLYKAQSTSSPMREELVGNRGTVINTIPENSFGSISYCYKGNTFTSAARSLKGERIEQGREIFIVKIEDHVFYVKEKNRLLIDDYFKKI